MKAARVDANQAEIVKALRTVGATVQSLATVHRGCPDLLVGYDGRNILLEVKDGQKVASARDLTPAQRKWHQLWRGNVAVVTDVAEAYDAIFFDYQKKGG